MPIQHITGEVSAVLRSIPEETFDACLCDPPYGLSSNEKRNMRRATPRACSRAVASGFMGMPWDAEVPGPEAWSAIRQALKPGAPLLAFGGSRTFHRLACALEDAGFLLADTICWLYGQGWPKGKAQLKPAWEPIFLCWKPGKRSLNIDACRIPAADSGYAGNCSGDRGHAGNRRRKSGFRIGGGSAHDAGRWPANVVLDPETAALLDQQSGVLISGANPRRRHSEKTRNTYGRFAGQEACAASRGIDHGGASRFFYCAKASQNERGEGNTHPTVKPLRLCQYLAKLILPPKASAQLLVPFAGSGSEVLGAKRAGWLSITAIEREPSYVAIARRRLKEN